MQNLPWIQMFWTWLTQSRLCLCRCACVPARFASLHVCQHSGAAAALHLLAPAALAPVLRVKRAHKSDTGMCRRPFWAEGWVVPEPPLRKWAGNTSEEAPATPGDPRLACVAQLSPAVDTVRGAKKKAGGGFNRRQPTGERRYIFEAKPHGWQFEFLGVKGKKKERCAREREVQRGAYQQPPLRVRLPGPTPPSH